MERAVEVFVEHFQDYVDEATDRVVLAGIPVYVTIPREVLRGAILRAMTTVREDIERGTTSAYPTYLSQIGKMRAQNGTPVGEIISGLDYGFQVVTDGFKAVFGDDLSPRLWWEERRRELSYAGALAITSEFYTVREAIIGAQHREILQLAAPIIPLHEGVLLIPLVGMINAERAAHVIQSLLESIMRQRSQAVIIDVTGMHATDESATDHLLHAAQAARLLGAKVILVGISPEVARTFTKAGANLGGLTILGDLASGVEYALRLLGRAITRIR
ncbi:MAG: STAS domain-containing protein [Byssovorax sp.]